MYNENLFQKYFDKRVHTGEFYYKEGGPVITISREHGCFARPIGEKLVEKFNKRIERTSTTKLWTLVTKEILEKSAAELKTDPKRVETVMDAEENNFFDEMLESLIDQYYVSNHIIIKTIQNIIRSYSFDGNVVIVGRASEAITANIAKSLHIKLIAPLEFRIKHIAEHHALTFKEAREKIKEIDKKRVEMMSYFGGDKPDNELYDLILNKAKFNDEEICDIIIKLAETKKFLA
jgi:cytidylate kinase